MEGDKRWYEENKLFNYDNKITNPMYNNNFLAIFGTKGKVSSTN
jgi:hypothetical protein